MKKLLIAVIIFLSMVGVSWSACSGGSPTWTTTPDQASVQTCVDNSVAGDTINILAGSATWSSSISINKGITLIGAGASTVINISSIAFYINGNGSGNYRVGKMTINSTGTGGSDMEIGGAWTSMRIDNIIWNSSNNRAIWLGRRIPGEMILSGYLRPHEKALIDHITYTSTVSTAGRPFLLIFGRQHLSWLEDDGFGTDNFVFIEDSTFTYNTAANGYITDTEDGGRYVVRYSTLINTRPSMHDIGGGLYLGSRGNRATEIYNNSISCPIGGCWSAMTFTRGGTGLSYNNTITGFGVPNSQEIYRVAYNSWSGGHGYCGDEVFKHCNDMAWRCTSGPFDNLPKGYDSATGTCPSCTDGACTRDCTTNNDCLDINGVANICMTFDGTGAVDAPGYPCRDQSGRGKDNPTTGVQSSSPLYWWNNTLNGSPVNFAPSTAYGYNNYIKENRDFCNNSPASGCGTQPAWTYTAYTYPHPWQGGISEDTVPPRILTGNPSGPVIYAATKDIVATTNENAMCAICVSGGSCDSDATFADVYASAGNTFMESTGTQTHVQTVSVAASTEYNYYISCRDTSLHQNEMTGIAPYTPKLINFTTGADEGPDTNAPVMTSPLPAGATYPCGEDVTLSVSATDDSGTVSGCKYNTTDVAYASMSGTFDAPGGGTGVTVDDFYSESNYQSGLDTPMNLGGYVKVAQSFTSLGGILDSAKFYLSKTLLPTGNAVVKIYAHTGTYGTSSLPTGDALATSDNFDVSTLITSKQLITFTFSAANRITLTATTQYVVSLEYAGGNGTNYIMVGNDTTSPTHSGNGSYYSGSWIISTRERIFYVYTSSGTAGLFSDTLTTPACGQSYTYYYRCTDGTTPNTSSQTATFTISGGNCSTIGCIEFEAGTNASPMIEYDDAAASGGQYVATTTDFQGTSTHSVVVGKAGTYRIIARVHATGTGDDSIFLSIDAGDNVVLGLNYTGETANWNIWRNETLHNLLSGSGWKEYHVVLTADTHTFVFTGRESGAKLDYFYLDPIDEPIPPYIRTTRFILGTGQTMTISPTTGGCQMVIE